MKDAETSTLEKWPSGCVVGKSNRVRHRVRRIDSPIAFSATSFLSFGWVSVSVTRLSEVSRKPRFTLSGALSDTSVVTVGELVGAGHYAMSIEALHIEGWRGVR